MRLRVICMFVIYLVITITTSGFGSIVVAETGSQDVYDVLWNDCTFTQALKELHAKLDIHSFAQVLDNETAPTAYEKKGELLSLIPTTLGHYYGRDFKYIGKTPVFYPFQLSKLNEAQNMIAGQLIASFTPEQLDMHKLKGFLPFTELNDDQQDLASFLARTFTQNLQYPEPELSRIMQESAIIMAITPSIEFEYNQIDEKGRTLKTGSSFRCDWKSSEDFWKGRLAGQLEASNLNIAAMTNPGADVPGDKEIHSLDGTYTLVELLDKLKEPSGSIRVEGNPNKIRIEAHCDMTAVSIARACAFATGMDWHRQNDGWYLAVDSAIQAISSFGRSVDSNAHIKEYERQIPAMQKIAYQGNMVLADDQVWQVNFDLKKVLDGTPILWSSLTPDQQDYLKAEAAIHNKTGSPAWDLVTDLPNMKLNWRTNIKFCIITKDGILYHEWLRFQPLFPPEGERDFLNQ